MSHHFCWGFGGFVRWLGVWRKSGREEFESLMRIGKYDLGLYSFEDWEGENELGFVEEGC